MQILGRRYPIKRVKGPLKYEGGEALALFDEKEGLIQIVDPVCVKTLTHELVHAVCDRINFQLDNQAEEMLAESIAIAVTDNFKLTPRSKRLVKYIRK